MLPPTLDFDQAVYSRYGSYVSITLRQGELLLRSLYGGLGNTNSVLFTLTVIDDADTEIPFEPQLKIDHVHLLTAKGSIDICVCGQNTVRIRGRGVGLRLTRQTAHRQFDNAFSPDGERWEVNAYDSQIKAGLRALRGTLNINAPWNRVRSENIRAAFLPDEHGTVEGEVSLFTSVWRTEDRAVLPDFDDAVAQFRAEFIEWLSATIPVPQAWAHGRILASYINWSAVIAPHGHHQRPTMLMSKNVMNKVWSWDHCFNALALAEQDPALAWDQFMLFFDHQDENGAIPDHLTDSSKSFRFYKPPIHGWTLRQLMACPGVVNDEQLSAIYHPLARWTTWWFDWRDDDRDGLPQYNHGNESGWDNGTVFADGVPVESPDLAAYLVIQLDVLAEVAARLGLPDEAAVWTQQAEALYQRMMAHFWDGERFVAKHANTHEVVSGDSSLVLMPLVLGDRLPEDVRRRSIAEVERFMTAHGVASEHPSSPYYESDGYWRGPIWAPSTYLLVDGLNACGETELALEISRRFCAMADRSGMAENYDALNGGSLRDRAYTWTASVFLLLGNLLVEAQQPA